MRARRLVALAAAAAMVGLVGMVPASLARFTDSDLATAAFSTAQLQPPTGLAGAGGPDGDPDLDAVNERLGDGYEVFRSATSGSGYASIGTVTPVTAASTTDSPGVGTWYYVLRTRFHNWSSVRSNEARVVVGGVPTSTGLKGCANNLADTGGDNNGYNTNPGNACAQDGLFASDGNSGTNASTLCSNTGKDRHRFWGYAFGMPASVTLGRGDHGPGADGHQQRCWDLRDLRRALVGRWHDVDHGPAGPVQHQGPDHVHDRRRRRHVGPLVDGGQPGHGQLPGPDHGRVLEHQPAVRPGLPRRLGELHALRDVDGGRMATSRQVRGSGHTCRRASSR